VRVFYGTDRLSELVNRDTLIMRLFRFTPAAVLIGLAVIGVGVVLVSRKPTWIIGTAALLVFSTLAVWHGISETIEIATLAAQEEPHYSAEKSERGRIDRGICEVSIPKTHDPGELEGPTITRLEFEYNPRDHITLRKTIRLQNDAFYEQLREQVASSPDRELLVFVHGFNVTFEDAARRTAQMAHDLKLQGAPVFFSWPADKYFLLTYGKDETSVSWSAPHLKEFLLDLVHNTDARAINLVGHSMGNRALTTALREIDLQLRNEARLFNQVVLAAPDIDADDFRDNIAPAIQRTAKQVTLYASSNDIALGASRLLHRNARAGDTSRGLVIVPGMVTIDVSNINGGPWGHSYYGASDPVLRDLHLLLTSLPPERRTWLNLKDYEGQPYWAFKPLGSSASVPAMTTPR
jgi:esterase/lipase superfamily enzyme